jgi:hypothetical protein
MDNSRGIHKRFRPRVPVPAFFHGFLSRELRTATCTGTPFADAVFREDLDRWLGLAAGRRTARVSLFEANALRSPPDSLCCRGSI